jgi:hypothetical protein
MHTLSHTRAYTHFAIGCLASANTLPYALPHSFSLEFLTDRNRPHERGSAHAQFRLAGEPCGVAPSGERRRARGEPGAISARFVFCNTTADSGGRGVATDVCRHLVADRAVAGACTGNEGRSGHVRQAMKGEVCLGTRKSGASQRPGPANRQLRPLLARARRDLPLPKPIKGAILVSKWRESGECRFICRIGT